MQFRVLPEDPAQRLRIRRLFLSACMYTLYAVPVGLATLNGIVPARVMAISAGASALVIVMLYVAFRLGLNRRLRDASLTSVQMVLATVIVLYSQIYAGPLRGAFLLGLMIVFVFGCFKLSTRQLLPMSLLCSAGYAATFPLIQAVEGAQFDWRIELILWATFTTFLPFLSIVAGVIRRLHTQLAASQTKLQGLLEEVTELATRDELTGTYNRRWILELLHHEKSRSDRSGETFAIALFDLDYFKRVNDTYGHGVGDTVLKEFVRTASRVLRTTDVLARYGGEEFLLFLPQASKESAQTCIDRIRRELRNTVFEGLPAYFRVTASIGIAQYQPDEAIAALIERADVALYHAKEAGRDRSLVG